MNLREFLDKVLPDSGTYYAATTDKYSNFRQHAVSSRSDLAERIEKFTQQHKNTYFATGAFNKKSRTAEAVKSKKAFYLDLDCGPGKEFADKKDAMRKFVAFCKAANILTPSIIVDSGNGIHIYWVLDKPVTPTQWLPIAEALKNACEEHSFQADGSVTADSARILRAPESVNYKDIKHPKPCVVFKDSGKEYTYEEIRHSLRSYAGPAPLQAVPDVLKENADGLSGGVGSDFKPQAKYIFEQCGVLEEVLRTQGRGNDDTQSCHIGKGYKEAFWQQTLYFLAFCEDGEEYAHEVSKGHADYTKKSTDIKWGQQLIKAQDPGRKPTVCNTFEQYMPEKCAACPHKGCFKSPTALGKPPPTDFPHGYSQDQYGVMRSDGEDKIRIMPYQINDFTLSYDVAGEGLIISFNASIAKVIYPVELKTSLLCDSKATHKQLSISGIALNKHQLGEFTHLMTSWAQQMQNARQVKKTTRTFGWCERGTQRGFTASNTIHWSNGKEETATIPFKDIAAMYTPTGDLETWKQIAGFAISQNRDSINVAIASAFASPLVQLTGVSGITLAIISESSGTGKSTALKIAQSVWGHPIKGVNALSDTINSVTRKLGVLSNLPAFWDELRMREDVEGFIKLLFQLGQGKEKSRLNQHSSFQEMGTWNLLMTVASNEYLTDHIDQIVQSTDAGRRRVFEVTVPNLEDDTLTATNMAMFKNLEKHYGTAGQIYSKHLAEHYDDVDSLVHKFMNYFTSKLRIDNNERFWLAFMASTMAGASLAKQLGLVSFDLKSMASYLCEEFEKLRNAAGCKTHKPKPKTYEYLTGFLNKYSPHTMCVDQLSAKGVKCDMKLEPDRTPVMIEMAIGTNDDIQYALANERGEIRIDAKAFLDYVYDNGGQPTVVLKELKDRVISFKETRAALGSSMPGSVGGRIRCFQFDRRDSALSDYF